MIEFASSFVILTQSFTLRQKKAYLKEEKAKANLFEVHDTYNPEGQHRSYQKDLKYVPRAAADTSGETDTFDPTLNVDDEKRQREGARILANEMKRKYEKKAENKRNRVEFEQEDVSYINKRNKGFNRKIARNFDKYTAEIRQNLERGTAL